MRGARLARRLGSSRLLPQRGGGSRTALLAAAPAARGDSDARWGTYGAGLAPVALAAATFTTGVACSGARAEEHPEPNVGASGSELSWSQIAKIPRPGFQSIGNVAFTPDGSHVLYLRSPEYGSLSRQLYATNLKTGVTEALAANAAGEEKDLTHEEKLRRERQRIMSTGVAKFQIVGANGSPGRMLIPLGGALFVREGSSKDAPMKRLFDPATLGSGALLDPQISEDGSLVCFVFSNEVYCVPADGSAPPRPLTSGAAAKGVVHGLADFLAQEEFDRYEGYWISPDAKWVVYEEVDEKHIPEYRIMHSGSNDVGPNAQEDHRYPFPGCDNPKVRLFVTGTAPGAKPTHFSLAGPFGDDFYLGRVQWMPDGAIVAQVISRDQGTLTALRLDPSTGGIKTLFTEKSCTWININDSLKPIGKTGKMLWASERTGFRHLYVQDPSTSAEPKQITSGNWQVDEVVGLDADAGTVYFLGTSEGEWLEKHLYRVPLAGGKPERLTSVPGMHSVWLGPKFNHFVDVVHSVGSPAVATLRNLKDGNEERMLFRNEDPKIAELGVTPPEFATLPSTDGKVTLQAALYKPDPGLFGPGPYPTVVSTYGGPHVQYVQNSWIMTMDLRAQSLRNRGFMVMKVDNRGSNRRGRDFEGALKHNMGSIEVEDQVAGVRWAVAQGLADPLHVGIYGWSYGGYLSLMCLARASNVFKAAVSGAPVTHWDGYDTAYTERYMGTPQSNPVGYKVSAVMDHTEKIKGDLMLVHGMIDENVHFRHTARLVNSLIAAQKPYQMLLFPNERHSPRSLQDREYMEERIFAFLRDSLKPACKL